MDALSLLAALAIAVPFLLALPAHYEPLPVLWAVIAAVSLAAWFVALPRYVWDLELLASDRRAHELFDDERARGYAAAAAVLLPFRSPFDDWR